MKLLKFEKNIKSFTIFYNYFIPFFFNFHMFFFKKVFFPSLVLTNTLNQNIYKLCYAIISDKRRREKALIDFRSSVKHENFP